MPQTRRLALILQQSSSGNHRPQPNNGDCHRTPPLHSATRPASSATSHRASPSRPDGRGQSRRWTRPALPTNFTPCQERHCYHAAPIPRIIADLESSSARLYTGSEMVEAEAHAQAFTTASPDAPPSEQHPPSPARRAASPPSVSPGSTEQCSRLDVVMFTRISHTTPPSIIHPLLTTSVFTSTVE